MPSRNNHQPTSAKEARVQVDMLLRDRSSLHAPIEEGSSCGTRECGPWIPVDLCHLA
jgi:hypothetical protein